MWYLIRAAAGIVSERRFSGSDRTPNRVQMYWTTYNIMLDTDPAKPLPDLFDTADTGIPIVTQDFFIYEQIKNGIPREVLAKNLGISLPAIETVVSRHMEIAAALGTIQQELYDGAINKAQIIV